jgi:hypothetical protein
MNQSGLMSYLMINEEQQKDEKKNRREFETLWKRTK